MAERRNTLPIFRIRRLLEQAREALPESAIAFESYDPASTDSIHTLETYRLAADAGEVEMALVALAGIARAVSAGPECWSALEASAQLIGREAQERLRAFRS